MQKNYAVEQHSLQRCFARFCKDTELLLGKAPVFVIDSRARIMMKRGCFSQGNGFESAGGIFSCKEHEFFASVRKNSDIAAVFLEDGKNKEFVVISKIGDGFSGCVVCSYGEEKCNSFQDYYQKLCSYKDYLDLSCGAVCSNSSSLAVTDLLRIRISGVYHLMNMATPEPSQIHIKESAIPCVLALEKLSGFIVKTSESFGEKCEISVGGENVPVMLSVRLMNVIVSCMGFVLRDSDDGRLFVSVSQRDEYTAALSVSSKKKRVGRGGIYKSHLLKMLDGMGVCCRCAENEETRTLELELKRAHVRDVVMSEPEQVQGVADKCFSQEWLADVICTIMDI